MHGSVHPRVRHPDRVVHYDQIDVKAPIADALRQLGIGWAEALISIGALAGITTVMLVLYFGLTRVVLAMSRDGLLLKPMASSIQRLRRRCA